MQNEPFLPQSLLQLSHPKYQYFFCLFFSRPFQGNVFPYGRFPGLFVVIHFSLKRSEAMFFLTAGFQAYLSWSIFLWRDLRWPNHCLHSRHQQHRGHHSFPNISGWIEEHAVRWILWGGSWDGGVWKHTCGWADLSPGTMHYRRASGLPPAVAALCSHATEWYGRPTGWGSPGFSGSTERGIPVNSPPASAAAAHCLYVCGESPDSEFRALLLVLRCSRIVLRCLAWSIDEAAGPLWCPRVFCKRGSLWASVVSVFPSRTGAEL